MKLLIGLVVGVFVFIVFGLFLALSTLWNGYVLSTLWAWFVVPTLHAPVISTLQAAGITLVVRFLTFNYDTKDAFEPDSELKTKKNLLLLAMGLIYPLLALIIGAVIHAFI